MSERRTTGFMATTILRRAAWLLVAAGIGCGGESPELLDALGALEQPIVNGTPTDGEPATVYIDVGCSGTLVTSKVVLTACHCLEGVGGNVDVFFGSSINGSGTWISSVDHEVFPGSCIGNGDLAMIALSQPGPATPIPINDRDLAGHIGEPVRVVGFGVTGEYGGGSGVKRRGNTVLDRVDNGVMYCDPTVQSGTCYGDSGGPNFMTFEGKEYVVGATSYGTSACGSGLDASARTDTHYNWLMQFIAEHDPMDCGADGQCAPLCDAPDPDCPCASDGFCTAACPDIGSDPDCAGCGDDGTCRADCPVLDDDCCAADGDCFAACGALDPDCGGANGSGPGSGSSSGSGGSGPSSGSGAGHLGAESDHPGDGGLVGSVSCQLGSAPSPAPPTAWLFLALWALYRRRG